MLDLYNSKAFEPLHTPGLIYGKELTGEQISMSVLSEYLGRTITAEGLIKDILFRDMKNSHLLMVLQLEDKNGNCAKGKLITNIEFKEELKAALLIGEPIKLSGMIFYDRFDELYMISITAIK